MGEQLYRLYDDNDTLLYVGISYSAIARFVEHRADKAWIADVKHIHIEDLGDITRVQALKIESRVIADERPLRNIAKNQHRDAATDASLTDHWISPENVIQILRMPEWQQLASALSHLLNRLDPDHGFDTRDIMRMLTYTLRVASIADCTCKRCDERRAMTLLWPVRSVVRRSVGAEMVEATYFCPEHGLYNVWWGPSMLNQVVSQQGRAA